MTARSPIALPVARLIGRETTLGLVAYASGDPGGQGGVAQGLLVVACALAWSATDGILGRDQAQPACAVVIEAIIVATFASHLARVLATVLGPMPVGW